MKEEKNYIVSGIPFFTEGQRQDGGKSPVFRQH